MTNKSSLKNFLYENRYFLIPYAIFLLTGIYFCFVEPKGAVSLWLNDFNTPFLDNLFYLATYLGDGIFFIIIILFFLFIRFRYSLYGVISYASSGIAAQILKYIFNTPRPKAYFDKSLLLHYVPGVSVYISHSFPSGHSASAFALFLFFAAITKKKPLGLIYFGLALFIAFSRVYLLQHFFIDIYFGSLLGVIGTILTFLICNRSNKLNKAHWIDSSLIKLFKK
ncbi:MAG: phosphatase PAP2 family protein [FCB group bacterium]|jgi:membrane-associated phospholipid phosphatase